MHCAMAAAMTITSLYNLVDYSYLMKLKKIQSGGWRQYYHTK